MSIDGSFQQWEGTFCTGGSLNIEYSSQHRCQNCGSRQIFSLEKLYNVGKDVMPDSEAAPGAGTRAVPNKSAALAAAQLPVTGGGNRKARHSSQFKVVNMNIEYQTTDDPFDCGLWTVWRYVMYPILMCSILSWQKASVLTIWQCHLLLVPSECLVFAGPNS